ncbi:MAG: glycosyltransferase family 1 protein [Acidobacteria bacterium]|nr:MAG: glycosyltransferase family 1 protein [Acidobacteriota bacterium]
MKASSSRIGIDTRSLSAGPPGIRTYVTSLLAHLPYLDGLPESPPRNNFLWNQIRVPLAFHARGWHAYHAPSYTAPLIGCRPLILTVHDVSYLANPDWYPYSVGSLRLRYYTASLSRADRIIVPSEFSRAELVKYRPEVDTRVRRIYQGVSEEFFPDPVQAQRARQELALPREFLLHVGDIHTRRNVPLIAEAARRLGVPLVLVGRVLKGGEEFRQWPLRFNGLSADLLRGVYSAATALVYPSLYEGFGLPVVEAMACGLPVVASRSACLPEICGDAGILVEADVPSFCEGIQRAASERERYCAAGLARKQQFSWEKTARETEKVYQEVVPGLAFR